MDEQRIWSDDFWMFSTATAEDRHNRSSIIVYNSQLNFSLQIQLNSFRPEVTDWGKARLLSHRAGVNPRASFRL